MNLEQLQKLPHKWWKKNAKYIPCQENLIIDFETFTERVNITPSRVLDENVKLLSQMSWNSSIIPSRFDWYYAINTEIMEYLEVTDYYQKQYELADIAIFGTLFLRVYYNYNILDALIKLPKHITYHPSIDIYHLDIDVEPLGSWIPDIKEYVILLTLWASSCNLIAQKIEHNKRREDHGNPRR